MGKYDGVVSDARVAITDVMMRAINNTGCSLAVEKHLSELTKLLAVLEQDRHPSLLSRFKDAMFDTPQDKKLDDAARRAADLTYQLKHCLACRCVTCPIIDDRCRCEGCLYGSHVVRCDGGDGVETREVEPGVYLVDGLPVVRAEYDRLTRRTAATLQDRNGNERRVGLDPKTGKTSPLL